MYTSNGDLSSSLINKVFYSNSGMVWISTEDGLNRFDGSKFIVYRNSKDDSASLAHNFVNNIFENSAGEIFVCTHGGIQIYDPANDNFSAPLKLKNGDNAIVGSFSEIVERANGEMFTLGECVYRIVKDGEKYYLEQNNITKEINGVSHGTVDSKGNLWLTKTNLGVYCLTKDNKLRRYMGATGDPEVSSIGSTPGGEVFVGTNGSGIFKYNATNDKFEIIDIGPGSDRFIISCIYTNNDDFLFIGTDGNGVRIKELKTGKSYPFRFESLASERLKVHSLTRDAFGNMWVGIFQKGLMKMPPYNAVFKSLDQSNSSKNPIGSSCITALWRDKDNILWVGTDNDGIYSLSQYLDTSKHYHEGVPSLVMSLFEDSRGKLWVASYDLGAGTLDKSTGVFSPVRIIDNGTEVKHVFGFAELPGGDLLVATMGNGLFRYNLSDGSCTKLQLPELNNWINDIVSSTDGRYFIGTYDGFYILSADLKTLKKVGDGNIVTCIYEDPVTHQIWLGTPQGLINISPDGKINKVYTETDGLPSRNVYAIEQGNGCLWISTNQGLSKFDIKDAKFINFYVDNGLPQNEFAKRSSCRDNNGNLFFGGINGIAFFSPEGIKTDGKKLTLRITDFMIGDKNVSAGTRSGGHSVIDVPIYEATEFRLGYDDNTFSIRINTKEFVSGTQTEFYYKFDNEEWSRILNIDEENGSASLMFTNVPSGKHTIRFKALNNGVETDELVITVIVDKVWYATWWAKMFYLIIAGALGWLVYRHFKQRREQERVEEKRRHQQDLLESKLQMFTNISHEIRTPLTLVISPLQKLIDKEDDETRSVVYRTIMRNANRILRLMNELMDLRKIDNKLMKMRYTKVNICGFINDLYETFAPAAAAKNIAFSFIHEGCDDVEVWVDKSNFDKIVMNLLSNAIKYTPKGESVTIKIDTGATPGDNSPLCNYLEICVTDTGIGISATDRERVFDRFFQCRNNVGSGSGIGLHLTRQLVELHHGSITVSDNPAGKGTRFTVRIPLGCEHINPEEIDTSTVPMMSGQITDSHDIVNIDIETVEENNEGVQHPRRSDLIYIVEDDDEIQKYLEINLSRYYRTCCFSNGKEALDAMHKKCPTLVITDVMMPEMDGMTLVRKIKQNINMNHVPIIVLTAKTREEDHIEAMENGAAIFINKPFNIDVLVTTVKNQIENLYRMRNAFSGNQSQVEKVDNIHVSSSDEKLLERVMKCINKNISNSNITVETIASEIGISRVHLHRKLKELTNQSTRDFIRNIRLQAAARILREKKLTVAEVADLVGFKQANNFSACFKEMYGMSPSAYSASHVGKKNATNDKNLNTLSTPTSSENNKD